MISTPDRQTAIDLIDETVTAGAHRAKACAVLAISDRTLRRWTKDGQIHHDRRPLAPRPEPGNKLSAEERAAVLDICNSEGFASLPPSQIVPKLADRGQYLASGVQLLSHLARGWATPSPWSSQAAGAAQAARQLQGQCGLPSLDLGVRRGLASPGSNGPGTV